jgi:hypothetical protein
VEVSLLVLEEEFEMVMQNFNPSQKKLVQIYIEKRLGRPTS